MNARRTRWVLVLGAAAAIGAGCQHPGRALTLEEPVSAAPATYKLAIADVPIARCADLEAFGQAFDAVGSGEEFSAIVRFVAQATDPKRAAADPGARCAAAVSIVRTITTAGPDRVAAVKPIADALRAGAPDAPETVFVTTWLRWVGLGGLDDRLEVSSGNRESAQALRAGVALLLDKHKDFAAPGGFDRVALKQLLGRLDAGLAAASKPAAKAAPAPADPTPTAAPAEPTPTAAPSAEPEAEGDDEEWVP